MVRHALDALVDHGVVNRIEGGRETVYAIEQPLAAAYYRNTIVHFFTTAAIAELALAAASAVEDDAGGAFWSAVRTVRDLLNFEFFFAEREEFRAELAAELEASAPGWRDELNAGSAEAVLRRLSPAASPWVLRPVFEAYMVLADALVDFDFRRDVAADELVEAALALGAQYGAQRRIRSPEAVSTVLFHNAVGLARNRGLLTGGNLDRLAAREAFAAEVAGVLALVERVEEIRS